MQPAQVIALLLPDTTAEVFTGPDSLAQGATALLRDAQGRMSVTTVTADPNFMQQAIESGCFKKGKPIIDPITRDVMGYEMEVVSHPLAQRTRVALGL